MIKQIRSKMKSSINFKVFCATMAMLLIVSGVIYACIMIAMPNTYQTTVNQNLEEQLTKLKSQLEKVNLEDSGKLLNQFMIDNYADIYLTNQEGKVINLPGLIQGGSKQAVECTTEFGTDTDKHNQSEDKKQAKDASSRDEKIEKVEAIEAAKELGKDEERSISTSERKVIAASVKETEGAKSDDGSQVIYIIKSSENEDSASTKTGVIESQACIGGEKDSKGILYEAAPNTKSNEKIDGEYLDTGTETEDTKEDDVVSYTIITEDVQPITQESVAIEMMQEGRTGKDKLDKKQAVETTQAMVMPINFKTDNTPYCLYVINYGVVIEQASHILIKILPIVLGVILGISALTAFIYARLITRPIKEISQTARRMATLDLRYEKESGRTDEIGTLSRALNELAAKLSKTLTDLTDSNSHLEEANANMAEVNGRLEEANMKLEEDIERERALEQKRREFFAAVSHELKTPLTIIKGQLEGMIYKVGSYKDRDTYLMKALGVTNRMEEMVLEILSISRMESSKFKLVREPISLKEIVTKSVREAEELASYKGIKVVTKIEDGLVELDKKMIKKVLDNVIHNGISHSPEGAEVSIQLERKGQVLHLAIENTGIHIEESKLQKVFEAFYRVEKSRNRQTGGTGLGLYIVKIILDMHKLSYGMTNTEKGVCFWINFTQNTN